MDESQFENFIRKKNYKTSNEFNNNPKDLLRLINYVRNLPVEKQSFQVLEGLIKFYKTPIFIVCQNLYQKVQKCDNHVISQLQQNIKQIASFIKNYLGQNILQSLNFFFFIGFSKKKKKIPQKSQPQRQFIKYISNLQTQLRKIKKQINQIGSQKLKLQLDSILAGGLQRKLNTLQQNYEQYFKNQADKIYRQHRKKIQDQQRKSQQIQKSLQPVPELTQKKSPLCCRTYFYDGQIIKEPQNLVIQYKNYFIPFGENQVKILKKTICAFLNAQGGTIYLGIQEQVDTKKRKIFGNQLTQFQKQNLIYCLRRDVIDWVKPDILANKMYWVSFVPVKQKQKPYNYIAGRYITKITVKYGLRNQIYSYRHDDKDYFSFRTENQVIHREGREILNAYRQRLKNPLPIPIPIHEGSCANPQQGNPINTQRKSKQDYPVFNIGMSQKRKYKEKDAMDFIIFKIKQKQLIQQMNKQNLISSIIITSDVQNYINICFIKVIDPKKRQQVIEVLSKLFSNNQIEFFESQRGIQCGNNCNIDLINECLQQNNIKVSFNEKTKILQFKSTQQSVQVFLLLKSMTFDVSFIGV